MTDLESVVNELLSLKYEAEQYSAAHGTAPPQSYYQAGAQLRDELRAMGHGDLAEAMSAGVTAEQAERAAAAYYAAINKTKRGMSTKAASTASASTQQSAIITDPQADAKLIASIGDWFRNLWASLTGSATSTTGGSNVQANTQAPTLGDLWSVLIRIINALIQYAPLLIVGWLILAFSQVFRVRARWGR